MDKGSNPVFNGLKVADFSWVVVGPFISAYLASYGATVVRVESATRPDPLRASPPFKDGVPGLNRSGFYTLFNSNKLGVSLNLNHPQGVELAKKIVSWADVVIENFAPGVMSKWGLSYEEVSKLNPDIIMLSTSNLGQTGPQASYIGYGTQLVAFAGFTHLTGWPDREPSQPYAGYTDIVAARFGAIALIAALDYRDRTGKGQYLDLSQHEASLHFLAPALLDYSVNGREAIRKGNWDPYSAPHGAYRCRGEDRWCVIAVETEEEWANFCDVIGNPAWSRDSKFASLASRKKHEEELDHLIEDWTRQYEPDEVVKLLQQHGVPAGMVQTAEELRKDPQLGHRHHFRMMEHPELGKYSWALPGFRLAQAEPAARHAPCLGEHNEYFYTRILSLSEEEFVRYLGDGVFD